MPECFGISQARSLSMAAQVQDSPNGKDHGVSRPQPIFLFHISGLACLSWYYDPLDEKTCTSVTQRGEDIQHLTI